MIWSKTENKMIIMENGGQDIMEVTAHINKKTNKIEKLRFKTYRSKKDGELVLGKNGINGYNPDVSISTNMAVDLNKIDTNNMSSLNNLLDHFEEQFRNVIMEKISMIKDLLKTLGNAEVNIEHKNYEVNYKERSETKIEIKYENAKMVILIDDYETIVSLDYNDGKKKMKISSSNRGTLWLEYKDREEKVYIGSTLGTYMNPLAGIVDYLNSKKQIVIDNNVIMQLIETFLSGYSLRRYIEIALDSLIHDFRIEAEDKIYQGIWR